MEGRAVDRTRKARRAVRHHARIDPSGTLNYYPAFQQKYGECWRDIWDQAARVPSANPEHLEAAARSQFDKPKMPEVKTDQERARDAADTTERSNFGRRLEVF